jgi:tetratricopeptide (TPR) repeat protein
MTINRPNFRALAAAALVFAAVLGLLTLLNGRSTDVPSGSGPAGGVSGVGARSASAAERVRSLQATIATGKATPRAYTELGDAHVQLNRETGDPAALTQAERAYRGALARDRRDALAVTGLATLAAARHDFRGALDRSRQAQRLNPSSLDALPVMVDALVELGRYDEAEGTLQRLVDAKPGLAAYARVSYFRELNGDLAGAADALQLAVSAGGSAPENAAFVRVLLGNLEFARGRIGAAEEAYRSALGAVPSYAPAAAGLARVDSAGGNLDASIERLRGVVDRLPLPEYAIALAETELAAGRRDEAAADFDVVRAEQRLLEQNGVDTDVEFSIFEAEHGSPARAVTLARRGWGAAPSVRSADALGWALTRAGRSAEGLAWARRSLRLGSRDPLLLYHAGIAARDANRTGEARTYLRRALALNPRFSPLHAPRAERALENLR